MLNTHQINRFIFPVSFPCHFVRTEFNMNIKPANLLFLLGVKDVQLSNENICQKFWKYFFLKLSLVQRKYLSEVLEEFIYQIILSPIKILSEILEVFLYQIVLSPMKVIARSFGRISLSKYP